MSRIDLDFIDSTSYDTCHSKDVKGVRRPFLRAYMFLLS